MDKRDSVTYGSTTWLYSATPSFGMGAAGNVTTVGSSGTNEAIYGGGGSALLGGGGGGDYTFYVGSSDTAAAGAGDGVDTEVSYWGSLTLSANVQNGVLESAGTLTGNALDNILTASSSSPNTLVAGSGSDLLIGSTTTADRFVVSSGSGNDVIQNFIHGSDVLELDNYSAFADPSGYGSIAAALSQQGSDVVLDAGNGQTVTFANQTVSQFSAADFALPFSTAGLAMTFDDEFDTFNASNGGYGTVWKTDNSGHINPYQNEVEYYANQNSPVDPYSLNNGVLDITAAPGPNPAGALYDSGEITTQKSFAQTYGYFETRAELPAGSGMWPAFWLLPASGIGTSEIDAPEQLGTDPNILYFSTHSADQPTQTVAVQVADTSQGFHTYGVDWEPNTITYYFDGNAVATLATPADMTQPMYMLLDLAVSGPGGWAGANTGETGVLQVDYVHAFATAATTTVDNAIGQPIVVNGYQQSVVLGDGQYTVTGGAAASTVSLGSGAETVSLTGSYNNVTTGDGNESISLGGSGSAVSTGIGASTIYGGTDSVSLIVAGTTPGATTSLSASGYSDFFLSTGAGNYAISGTLGYATVDLAAGDQSINLGGSGNFVSTGIGASTIYGGTDWANITVAGTTTGATTALSASGYFDAFTSTGAGDVSVSGTLGYATVNLAAGDDTIDLGGSGNNVTIGVGTSTVTATGGSSNVIHAAGGNDTITVLGWGNLLDAGPGTNTLNGGYGWDTFLLNGAGQGTSTVTGFSIWNGDVLNLARTVAGLGVSADLSNLGTYVTATVVGGDTELSVTPPGSGSSMFAVLSGVQTSVATLIAQNSIRVS